jgi:hypothetical protein
MTLLSLLMDGSNDLLSFDFLAFGLSSPSKGVVSVSPAGVTFLSASQFRLREQAKRNLIRPITA